MISCIAIDDEPMALEIIDKHTAALPFIELLAAFTHTSRAITFLNTTKVDLIFLDIRMPGISGIELLQSLANRPLVIFTTAYPEHAVESFELEAIDYLLKPFSAARFSKACSKALEQYELRRTFDKTMAGPPAVFIKSGYEQIRMAIDEIRWVEASGSYVQFVTDKKKILSRISMTEAETLLPQTLFVRTHRSYLVSVKHITKVEKMMVWMGQSSIPVSATFTERLHAALKDNFK